MVSTPSKTAASGGKEEMVSHLSFWRESLKSFSHIPNLRWRATKLRGKAKRKMAVGTRSNEQRAVAIMQEVVRAQHGQICFLLLHFEFFCWGSNNRWTGAAAEEKKMLMLTTRSPIQQNWGSSRQLWLVVAWYWPKLLSLLQWWPGIHCSIAIF